MNNTTETINAKIDAVRMAGGAALVTIWGITLNEWAAIAAIVYTALQSFLILPRVIKQVKEWHAWWKDVFKK